MTANVLPYLVAPRTAALHSGWKRYDGAHWVELGDALPDWDFNTDLAIAASVTLDDDAFLAGTGVERDCSLRLVVSWRSVDFKVGATALRLDVTVAEMADAPVHLNAALLGGEIGGVIAPYTRLELGADRHDETPGRATFAGSVLWQHEHVVAVEGNVARFPVAVVDFAAAGLDRDASWVLDVPGELDAPVLGSLLLMINERDGALVAAVDRDPEGPLVAAVTEGVAVELLDLAVQRSDELVAEQWDDGTLGNTLAALGSRAEGGLAALAALREARPAAYRAALVGQARRSGLGRSVG